MNSKTTQKIDSDPNVDGQTVAPITFVSYSRRQLYFAESIALHLQNQGINIWFDLQQLQAGTVWEAGLEGGVRHANRLVLIVSKAALDSSYTRNEWSEVVERGDPVVLVLFEPVDLPEELQGLPTYDFRNGFNRKLLELVAFLKDDAEPRYDSVSSPNRLGFSSRLPGAVWLTLTAQFGCLITCILGLLFAVSLNTLTEAVSNSLFWYLAAFSLAVGTRYAVPFLRHTLEYRKVKRGVLVNLLLLIPTFFIVGNIVDNNPISQSILGGAALLLLFVYFYLLRRSGGLLRWMRPEDGLQKLRRYVHQSLVPNTTLDVTAGVNMPVVSVTYLIHADDADQPFERFVENILLKVGHQRASAGEEPQHHIAILSNRSSTLWAQALANTHAGKLVFIVASTIEFSENLAEVGRYQWVDARDMNRLEVAALARSLGNEEAGTREAALETTPAMIDHWKVPTEITELKRVLEWLGILMLIFGLTDLIGATMTSLGIIPPDLQKEKVDSVRSAWLVIFGISCFWLASKGLVYRKVSGPMLYGLLCGIIVIVSLYGNMGMAFMKNIYWLPGSLLLVVVLNSWLGARAWLPAFSRQQHDEVGIKKSIERSFRKKRLMFVTVSVMIIVLYVVSVLIGRD
ncbi:MAG: uncharacterized membrane protein (DUF441 family) [Candidatus Azotimanducaceae bacterium]|jgi:uncharacterized membrane protein (DUF441 family)